MFKNLLTLSPCSTFDVIVVKKVCFFKFYWNVVLHIDNICLRSFKHRSDVQQLCFDVISVRR